MLVDLICGKDTTQQMYRLHSMESRVHLARYPDVLDNINNWRRCEHWRRIHQHGLQYWCQCDEHPVAVLRDGDLTRRLARTAAAEMSSR